MSRGPLRWLHSLGLGRPQPEEAATLEVEHHLSELTDRLVASGLKPEEARREAERHFGDRWRYVTEMQRLEARGLRGDRWQAGLELVGNGFLSAARTMRRQPGFAAAVVVTLGLGIGANATMYGIVDRLLLRGPEHVVDPERVVRILVERPDPFDPMQPLLSYLAYPDIEDWRAHRGLELVAAYESSTWYTFDEDDSRSALRVQLASPELFPLLGVEPVLGRFYEDGDIRAQTAAIMVLSHDYWMRAYGGDPGVLGRQLSVDGRPSFTIIGVAPRHFTGPELRPVDAWVPIETQARGCVASRRCNGYQAVARLRDGASVPAAETEATALHLVGRQELIAAGSYSDQARVVLANLIAARGPDSPGESRVARWLAGVAVIVFLVACANVAGLLLARNEQRSRETEVRLALGAGRGRIGAQIMFETLALATLGGALAMLFARWGGGLIRATLLPDVYFPASTLTPRLALFTVATTILAAILAGCTPALRGAERRRNGQLQSGARATASTATVRRALTVVQAGFAVVLLVGAGLFVRSLDRLRSLDLGLDVDRVAMAQVTLRSPDMARADQIVLFEELSRRLAALPAVESAASTSSGLTSSMAVETRVRGLDSLPRMPGGGPYVYVVPPEYFATGGLEIIDGRGFGSADVAGTARVAVVSETMARTLWPAGGALGQCILRGRREQEECMEVVGVVQDAARNGYFDAPSMAYYLPLAQNSNPPNGIYIRGVGAADEVVRDATALLRSIPEIRFVTVNTLRDVLDPQARTWSLGATLFSAFGLLALLVAAIGLYSLLAFEVAQRTREIGIRSALGARKGRLLGWIVSGGVRAGGVGIALGLGVAYFAAPYIQGLLFETSARDVGVFAVVAAVLLAVSLLAGLIPGLRATRVDPMTALRTD